MGRTADWYSNFSREARGQSQVYEDWAIGVAEDARFCGYFTSFRWRNGNPT